MTDKMTKAFALGELRYGLERDIERNRTAFHLFDGRPGIDVEAWVASRRRCIQEDEARLREIEALLAE